MDYQKLNADRANFDTDSEFLTYANSVEYAPKACDGIGYGTVRVLFGLPVASAVGLALKNGDGNQDPVAVMGREADYQIYLGGRIEMDKSDSIVAVNKLKTVGILTEDQANQLLDIGRTVSANAMIRYGVAVVDAAVLAAADRFVALKTLKDDLAMVYNIASESIVSMSNTAEIPSVRQALETALTAVGK